MMAPPPPTTTIAVCLWALVWTNCCHPMVVSQTGIFEQHQVNGALYLRCGQSHDGLCRDECSNPARGRCWPSTARALRDNTIIGICHDRISNGNRMFTSEIVNCTLEGAQFDCRVNLANNERTVYLAVKFTSGGDFVGYTSLNGEDRPAPANTRPQSIATLYAPGGSPLENLNAPLLFSMHLLCPSRMLHCNIRAFQMLVVKYRC